MSMQAMAAADADSNVGRLSFSVLAGLFLDSRELVSKSKCKSTQTSNY